MPQAAVAVIVCVCVLIITGRRAQCVITVFQTSIPKSKHNILHRYEKVTLKEPMRIGTAVHYPDQKGVPVSYSGVAYVSNEAGVDAPDPRASGY